MRGDDVSMTMLYTYMESPVGDICLAGHEGGLRVISFQEGSSAQGPVDGWRRDSRVFASAVEQLQAYFEGELRSFDVELDPVGTRFQRKVWEALRGIPWGETIPYRELAVRVDRPGAWRAVGSANGKNPLPIIVPCHRVIGRDGSLRGYRGGLRFKEFLLRLEGASTALDRGQLTML